MPSRNFNWMPGGDYMKSKSTWLVWNFQNSSFSSDLGRNHNLVATLMDSASLASLFPPWISMHWTASLCKWWCRYGIKYSFSLSTMLSWLILSDICWNKVTCRNFVHFLSRHSRCESSYDWSAEGKNEHNESFACHWSNHSSFLWRLWIRRKFRRLLQSVQLLAR